MNFYQNSPLTPEAKTNKTKSIGILVAVIVVLIIIVVIVFYGSTNQPSSQDSIAEERANIIEALENQNYTPPTAEERASILKALESQSGQ